MNISFIGYRCSGKSTVSEQLEKMIGWKKIEVDREIENYYGMNIPQIIEKFGWKKFRDTESKLIKENSQLDNIILDLGGGAVLNENNIKNIKKNGLIIFLNCKPELIKERLEKSYYRPPLTNLTIEDEIKKVLGERLPLYNKYSNYSINTDSLTIEQTVNLSIYFIREYKLLLKSKIISLKELSYTLV